MAKILIVDDDHALLQILAVTLREAGHEITVARDGREAGDLLKRIKVDLLITDIVMPNKEGVETIVDARRDAPDMKILAMSGGGLVPAAQYLFIAQKLGADSVLSKPFHREELLAAIGQLLPAV